MRTEQAKRAAGRINAQAWRTRRYAEAVDEGSGHAKYWAVRVVDGKTGRTVVSDDARDAERWVAYAEAA